MRPTLSLVLGLVLAASAGAVGAQNFQQWGDAQNGGYSYSSGPQYSSAPQAWSAPPAAPSVAADPRGRVTEEETIIRQWGGSPPQDFAPQQQWAGPGPCCGGQGGYEIPTYGYAAQNYGWPGQGCCMAGNGEISLGYGSWGYGGVGGVPWTGPWGGGGYYRGANWSDTGWREWDGRGWRDVPGLRPPTVQPLRR